MAFRRPIPSARPAGPGFASGFVLVALLACPVRMAGAGPSEQVPVGPRAIAMGGAYTSLAQDASAMFWNPAGLSRIGHQEVAGTYANLFQSDVKDNFAAFVLPISRRHAVGIDWYHSGFDDPELDFGENRFDLSWSSQVHSLLSAGITAKYLTRNTALDGATVSRGNGVGMDLGLLATPMRGVRVGAVAQDVFDTRISHSGGGSTVAFPRNVRVGASYTYRDRATLAADVDDRWHLGLEVRPLDLVALRAGMEDDREGPDGATFTAGAGFKAGIFRADYAYVMHPSLAATSHFGLSMAFNFNPARIRIEKIETDEVFASLYKTYERVPFGRVVVRNLQDEMLTARVSVLIPDLMDAPSEQEVSLRPGAATTIYLHAVFAEKVMARRENFRAPVHVAASYKSERVERKDQARGAVAVFAPGSIDWNRGLEQTAAFITVRDPVVDSVASRATHAVSAMAGDPFGNRNVAKAASIFDALGVLGVVYLEDPDDPYPSISERAKAVDLIKYPRQTLEKRSGDCDDTTVLLAALLQNVGIRTKLVDVPRHIFLLFDSGRHERDRRYFGVDEDMLVVADEGLWIPLETTALGRGFAEAWRLGAQQVAAARASQTLELVDVSTALSRFESSLPATAAIVPALDLVGLRRKLQADADTVAGWRASYLASFRVPSTEVEITSDTRDELAHMSYLAGGIEDAVRQLEDAAAHRPRSARALNNLGNARAVQGDFTRAVEQYERALVSDREDAGIWLNLGLVHHALGDTAASSLALAEGLSRAGGYAEACALLGLLPITSADRGGTRHLTLAETRRLLKGTLGKVPLLDSLRASRGLRPRPPKTLPPIRTIMAATRGAAGTGSDLRSFLYWRERE